MRCCTVCQDGAEDTRRSVERLAVFSRNFFQAVDNFVVARRGVCCRRGRLADTSSTIRGSGRNGRSASRGASRFAKWVFVGKLLGMLNTQNISITSDILKLIAQIDEFKGAWRALGMLAPERLLVLRRVATIESIGSSTRIEGSKLTNRDVEALLARLEIKSFATRDEQEVAGYAEVMELVFSAWEHIPFSENHIKQLHRDLLVYVRGQRCPPPGALQDPPEPRACISCGGQSGCSDF